jgi:hypothetical protein
MIKITGATLTAVSLLLLGAASFKAFSLRPVDEASLQPDFEVFRASLLAAVQQKDVAALMGLVDENVRVSSRGAQDGAASFRRHWELEQTPAQSQLWGRLGRVLELGGTFQGDRFVAPYIHTKWPEEYDRAEYGFISGSNVNIRGRAALDAPAVKQANYEVVRFVWDSFAAPPTATVNGETWPWVKVALATGHEGYVWGKFFHGGLDYRAEFRQVGGQWKLVAFVAGS